MTEVRRDEVPNDQGTDQSAEPLNYEIDMTPQDFVDRFLNDSDSALPKLNEDQLNAVTALDDTQESVVYQQMVEMLSRTGEPSDEQKMFHDRLRDRYLTVQFDSSEQRTVGKVERLKGADAGKSGSEIWTGKLPNRAKVFVIKKVGPEKKTIKAVIALKINPQLPRIIDRNMMFAQIGRVGGEPSSAGTLGVVPETTFGYAPVGESNAVVLVSMIEKVEGRTGRQWLADTERKTLESSETAAIARDLTRIQYLDYLMTQVDRQVGNFMMVTDANNRVVGIQAIDNDFSLAETDVEHKPNLMPTALIGVLQFGLPPIADQATKEFFDALNMDEIDKIAAGRLTKNQRGVVKTRLKKIQDHLQSDATTIIENDQWGQNLEAVQEGLGESTAKTYYDVLAISDRNNLVPHKERK